MFCRIHPRLQKKTRLRGQEGVRKARRGLFNSLASPINTPTSTVLRRPWTVPLAVRLFNPNFPATTAVAPTSTETIRRPCSLSSTVRITNHPAVTTTNTAPTSTANSNTAGVTIAGGTATAAAAVATERLLKGINFDTDEF